MKKIYFKLIELESHQVMIEKQYDKEEDTPFGISVTFYQEASSVKVSMLYGYGTEEEMIDAFETFSIATAEGLIKSFDVDHEQEEQTKSWPGSSSVDTTTYYRSKEQLDVKFKNGKIYTYPGFPAYEWDKLIATESIGNYINRVVKPFYKAQEGNAKPSSIRAPHIDL